MKHWKLSLALIPSLLFTAGIANAQVIAVDTPGTKVGNQTFGGSMGLDFTTTTAVQISALGYFDSGNDGVKGNSITVTLYQDNTGGGSGTVIASQTFTGTAGTSANPTAVSAFRFLNISPLNLAPGGNYRIVASGFGALDPNGNSGLANFPGQILITTSGSAIISWNNSGAGYFALAPGVFPTTIDTHTYLAGSFKFSSVPVSPEPGAIALLFGASISGSVFARRLRRKK